MPRVDDGRFSCLQILGCGRGHPLNISGAKFKAVEPYMKDEKKDRVSKGVCVFSHADLPAITKQKPYPGNLHVLSQIEYARPHGARMTLP